MTPPITFAICVEPGSHRLEYKAATLFFTMRRNMGELAQAPIFAYAPRPNRAVAPWCREMMEHFEATVEYGLGCAAASFSASSKTISQVEYAGVFSHGACARAAKGTASSSSPASLKPPILLV